MTVEADESLPGLAGEPHSAAARIGDPEQAYIWPAKILAMCAIDLLGGDATRGRAIAAQPRKEFLATGFNPRPRERAIGPESALGGC